MSAPPAPDDFALAQAATPLAPIIDAEIAAAGGRITFARFMALALGHPEHGYYARPGLAWGRDGDYETSPEVHPVFGYLWARQVAECWERLGSPAAFDLVEPGAGSGAFMASMLDWLRARAPECHAAARVTVLDGHPRRVEEQRAALAERGHDVCAALLADWLAEPDPVEGVVISNELFDAFPVHLVERRGDELREWHVVRGDGGLALELGELSTPDLAAYFARLGVEPGEGCRAEVSLAAVDAMRALAARVGRGYIVTIDYGYEAERLYAPWRRMGTLMAFRDHSPQPDPLAHPGRTDLTAHVDLTSLTAAAAESGLTSAPPVSQTEALIALGIGAQLDAARTRAPSDLAAYATARAGSETLLDPAGLGRVRVVVMGKGVGVDGLMCLQGVD